MRPRAGLLLLCLLPNLAMARWYQVEVVVFKHGSAVGTGGEQWPALIELPDFSNALELLTEVTASPPDAAAAASGVAMQPAFKLLRRSERRLVEVERRLRNSSDYVPLLAAAWRQPSTSVSGVKRVHLADVVAAPVALDAGPAVHSIPRVEGTVAVRVARRMSVDIDFIFDNAGVPVRLQESRAMKLREVHYFDHPLFGVIVQILPYVLPNEDPSLPGDSDEPEDEALQTPPAR